MNWLLLPFALLFGLLVRARNYLYDINFLHSKSYKVPVIIIGNLTVGGTGKTPHVEYLVEYLKDNYRITTLSRGYKRKTKGYIEATAQSTANQIGDEPLQIKLKYPEIQVVVDENRTHAIDYLINQPLKPEVIILDDAYQHRKVKGSLNIVLIDYNRPVYNDFYLPMGRLRETKSALKRAHTIIITKCPEKISIDKQHEIIKKLKLKDHQGIYFTRMDYGKLTPLFIKSKTTNQKR
jgi:tetraacyldisaccharide 4'-kinase